jgi:transcriptional regulator with XRE-family HTH domain
MISSAQARGARALLGWTQDEVTERAGVTHRTLSLFESGLRSPHRRTLMKIKAAFEDSGVVFVDGPEGVGVLLPASGVQEFGNAPAI